jgi:kumamolisin
MSESRQILPGSTKKQALSATLLTKTSGAQQIEVTVVLVRRQKIENDDLQQHALMKPHDRPGVDHAAFAAQFGASDEAIAAVNSFAATFGLRVANTDQRRRVMRLSGSVANMERAFGTSLSNYSMGPRSYRGRQGPLLLPTEIVGHVEAVLGLDNRPVAKPRLRSRVAQTSYYPNALAGFYNFPAGDGANQTIALIELGGNLGTDDLQTYFRAAGLTREPTVQVVSVDQGVPIPYGQDTQSDTEVMLDIQVVGAMAPGATIVVYFAENTDQGFYEAVSQAVHHPSTTAVSISWGSPEKNWTEQTMNAWASLGQGATLLNVPIFVAAGDHGCVDEEPSDDGYDGQRHADFPGTCPAGVVSCGATSIQTSASTITQETVWNEGDGWATGGGASAFFQLPVWQKGISADGRTPLLMRGVPDVSADGDSNTGIKIRVNGADSVSGGTSAVAPQWAALTAILSQKIGKSAGFFIPLLYSNGKPGATNDIVQGNNTVYGVAGFSAKSGWDACTGLGSPNGGKILTLLTSAAAPIPSAGDTPPETTVSDIGTLPIDSPGTTVSRAPQPFNAAAAVSYGLFVQAAYSMYTANPNSVTPAPSPDFPKGFRLSAWIQMQDFIIGSTDFKFYGVIAQSMNDSTQFVLAIRGTSSLVEWWDDLNAGVKVPFKDPGCGSVGDGFARIYDTLQVVECPAGALASAARPQSLKSIGGFSQQVSDLLRRHSATYARTAGMKPSANVTVTGHSLGSALATLYVMDNAHNDQINNPLLCTFASPRVGDQTFVDVFNALDLTSWRIVNKPDVVPMLPPESFGFADVNTVQYVDSKGKVFPSVGCWHALSTYLSLLDDTIKPSSDCQLPSIAAANFAGDANSAKATTISVPAGGVTVNITLNINDDRLKS